MSRFAIFFSISVTTTWVTKRKDNFERFNLYFGNAIRFAISIFEDQSNLTKERCQISAVWNKIRNILIYFNLNFNAYIYIYSLETKIFGVDSTRSERENVRKFRSGCESKRRRGSGGALFRSDSILPKWQIARRNAPPGFWLCTAFTSDNATRLSIFVYRMNASVWTNSTRGVGGARAFAGATAAFSHAEFANSAGEGGGRDTWGNWRMEGMRTFVTRRFSSDRLN